MSRAPADNLPPAALRRRAALARRVAAALLLALLLGACGTLEVGVERAPTPDAAPGATAAALAESQSEQAARVAELETRVAELAAAPPTATPAPAADLGALAYVQGGDIWVRALPDGAPQRLTSDGRSSAPRWSPSGAWLSFRRDGALWLMRSDGTASREVPKALAARWAPGDDRLAYVHEERGALMLIAADALPNTDQSGAGAVILQPELGEGEWAQISEPVWSYDGAQIAAGVARRRGDDGALLETGVWVGAADGSGAGDWYRAAEPPARLAPLAWGGDGESLVLWQIAPESEEYGPLGLALLRQGGQPEPIEGDTVPFGEAQAGAPGLGVVLMRGAGISTWEQKRLTLVAPSGELLDLTGDDTVALSPALAPDQQRAAYAAMPAGADLLERRIWVRDLAEGGAARQLTGDALYRDERPRWSADGATLLFARMTRDGRASLWLVSAEGGAPARVVDELTPAPSWWGADGYIPWDELFDWWPGPNSPSGR